MTQLTQAQPRTSASILIAVALAASIFGAIVGGLVGTGVQVLVQRTTAEQVAEQAKWDAYGADWQGRQHEQRSRYLSPRDQAVLEAAQQWEARYREMYPGSN